MTVDTSSRGVRESYRRNYAERQQRNDELLTKYGIDHIDLATGEDFVKPLMMLFKMRG